MRFDFYGDQGYKNSHIKELTYHMSPSSVYMYVITVANSAKWSNYRYASIRNRLSHRNKPHYLFMCS